MSDRSDRIEGERDLSETAARRRLLKPRQAVALFALGSMGIVAFVFYRDGQNRPAEPEAPTTQIGMVVPAPPPPASAPIVPAGFVVPNPFRAEQPAAPSLAATLPQQDKGAGGATPRRMLSYGGSAPAQPTAASTQATVPVASAPERTSVAFKAGRIPGIKAGPAMDTTLVLMPSVLKCTLSHAIDTTIQGPIYCNLSEPAKSPAGITLMEKGTQIVASYSSDVQQGHGRLPAMSAYAITPLGVPVAITGTMGDALGRAGIAGEVDNHTAARFGGALLLMLTQGSIQTAQSALQSQGRGNSYTNLNVGGLESAVSEALRSTINIPPTITVPQGAEIAFLSTQPIDFSDAYELRSVR